MAERKQTPLDELIFYGQAFRPTPEAELAEVISAWYRQAQARARASYTARPTVPPSVTARPNEPAPPA